MQLELISGLRRTLLADIDAIHQPSDSATAQVAVRRLRAVADNSPSILVLLAEPWLDGPPARDVKETLVRCARIHLYLRILDDALDENLLVHRLNLLRSQPLFWDTMQGIGAQAPAPVAREVVRLISETVDAVQRDDCRRDPAQWGAKNHHLLLLPLLLSRNSAAYQACRPGLSTLLALIQTGDEWRQGELETPQQRDECLAFLCNSLEPDVLALLSRHGWHAAAQRIAWHARHLIGVLGG